MNSMTAKIGRILYAFIMIVFSSFHFMNASEMAAWVPLPGGVFWVYLTGVALLGAGVSLIIQKRVKLVALLLAIMLVIFAIGVDLLGLISAENDMMMQISMSNLLKDLALAGGALFISGVYGDNEDSEASSDEG